jgi:hypothetical protein
VAAGAVTLPYSSWATSGTPTIVHIIRIQMAPDISPKLRAKMSATISRFKQIHALSKYVVGRDITPEGEQHYDLTQVSFLEGEKKFRDCFDDPIHLAADREAHDSGEKPFTAATGSFDTITSEDDALLGRLNKFFSERQDKCKVNDTRPTSPPVPDRPEGQRWNYGTSIFRIVRVNLSGLSDAGRAERLTAMERLKMIRGVKQVFVGANWKHNPMDRFTHAVFVAFENEDAYHRYVSDPIHEAERQAGGTLAVVDRLIFDVIDPNDGGLAERLKKLHADTGA